MFSSERKETKNQVQEDVTIERNRISQKTIFKGNITSQGDFRIDGTVEGNLTTTGKVIIGRDGKVLGKMKCLNADIEGIFDGLLEVQNSLCLKPSAKVHGEVFSETFTVEPGAVINANCTMLSAVKELKIAKIEQQTNTQKQEKISKIS